jgi:hypothetical protein
MKYLLLRNAQSKFPPLFLLFLVFLFFPVFNISADFVEIVSDGGSSGVDLKDGLLKISVEKEPFQEVLNNIALKTGIKFTMISIADEEISMNSDYVPLEKGLQNLLAGRSFILFYQSDESDLPARLTEVWILPEAEEKAVVSSNEAVWKKSDKTAEQSIEQKDEVRVDSKKIVDILKGSALGDEDIKGKFYEALQGMRESEGFKELEQSEDEASRTDLTKDLSYALGERNSENLKKTIESMREKQGKTLSK